MTAAEAILVREVNIEPAPLPEGGSSLADEYHYICNFCEKNVVIKSIHAEIYEKLVKSDDFYCANCLRFDFHTKKKRDVLRLSFRGIFSYIYYREYAKPFKERTVHISQIYDAINAHQTAGLLNPAFSYDPETYIWFIDFSKIGQEKRKMSLDEVYKTIVNVLACFNLYESIASVQMHKLYDKYNEAIKLFYDKRQRPEGKELLVPTLSGCGGTAELSFSYDKTRTFLPQNLRVR